MCHWPPDIDGQSQDNKDTVLGYQVETLERLLGAEAWSDGKMVEILLGNITFMNTATCISDIPSEEKPVKISEQYDQPFRNQDHWTATGITDVDFVPGSYSSPEAGTSVESNAHAMPATPFHSIDMFQLVFALQYESSPKVKLASSSLYEHIALPLSSSLRQLQGQSKWLDSQCRALLADKVRSRAAGVSDPALGTLHQADELIWALQEIYEAIRQDSIASIRLGGIHMSLQVPRKLDDTISSAGPSIAHQAVLLLQDKSKLLQELDHEPGSAPLAFFVTHVVATKSLLKLSGKLNLHIEAVVFLATHLVKWRKARLVAPLHARNTYVADPQTNMDDLPRLETEYSKKFAALPDLKSILGMLGAQPPVVYGSCFPSRAHRDTYMDILAWLVRHKLVVRLRSIGWLCLEDPPPDLNGNTELSHHAGQNESSRPKRLIINPIDLSVPQQRHLRTLLTNLEDGELDIVAARITSHLDGEHTLEDIASIEGLKRAKVEDCLQALREADAMRTIQCL